MPQPGFSLDGKTALITGASSGIGAALAVRFAQEGATVGICARRADRLEAVLAECQRHQPASRMWVIDLGDLASVHAFGHVAEKELGGIDVLVNNAGIPKRRLVEALTPDDVDEVMRVNYLSPVRLTLALLPGLRQRSGRLVNVLSVAARLCPPGEAAYAASKAALAAFSESLAVETWAEPFGVHVVCPGLVATELFDVPGNDPLLARDIEMLPPADVADAIVRQLSDGTFETYVPSWFGDVAAGKCADPEGFLAGSAAYLAEQTGG